MSTLRCLFWNIKKPETESKPAKTEKDRQKREAEAERLQHIKDYLDKADADLLFLCEAGKEAPHFDNWEVIQWVANTKTKNGRIKKKLKPFLVKVKGEKHGNSVIAYRKTKNSLLRDDLFCFNPSNNDNFKDEQGERFRVLNFSLDYPYNNTIIKLLFFVVHLPSKMNRDEDTALIYAARLNEEIQRVENEVFKSDMSNDYHTIVVGDFNANPYDRVLMHSSAFNAPYAKASFFVKDQENKYGEKPILHHSSVKMLGMEFKFPLFYNPIWTLMGKANHDLNKLQGSFIKTVYDDPNKHKDDVFRRTHNFFDQVLVRPSLISSFVLDRLNVLEPEKADLSDHYPLYFELDLEQINLNLKESKNNLGQLKSLSDESYFQDD